MSISSSDYVAMVVEADLDNIKLLKMYSLCLHQTLIHLISATFLFKDISCMSSADFFLEFFFFKKLFWEFFIVSSGLVPDQDRQSIGSDLGLNCLQRVSVAWFPPLTYSYSLELG